MKYLVMLIIGASPCYGQFFNGTITDLSTGRIQKIDGAIDKPYAPYQPQIDAIRQSILETRARSEAIARECEAMQNAYYLREQTELLRKIANE